MLGEFLLTREKLSLFEEERRRLVIENNQFKTKYDNLSRSIDSPKSGDFVGFSPKSAFIIENTPTNPFEINEKSIEDLQSKVEKLIEDLKIAKDNFEVTFFL